MRLIPMHRLRLPLVAFALLLAGCMSRQSGPRLFEQHPASHTNVTFRNDLAETPAFNILNYLYYYDGGGVAAGDVNNDGLVDLYFTANELPNRLYLNRGDFVFEDVTEQASVAGSGNWTTGVAMADVNGDGWLDLYVTALGGYLDRHGRNQLFINRGDGTFTEQAAAYGLDFQGFSTHAAFFDYDRDGDLDVYLLNHSVHSLETHQAATLREERHPQAGDRLYRNDLDAAGARRFTDVSAEAGIYGSALGYGLGVAVSDLDVDGCPDVYVANDFHENDYLYYNNCDGTFTESIRRSVGHTSRSSMGLDAADVNNDGLPDVLVLDMLPEREEIRKTSEEAEPFAIAELKERLGYYHQYVRNMLQLNRGGRRFSEIGQLAGIEATDWSWAPLLADLDNDGRKDLFVSNGIYRRPNDFDFINYIGRPEVQQALSDGISEDELAAAHEHMPQVRIPNYAFRNDGDLTFTSVAAAWGLDDDAFANGAAYADLDNDGDLDLVTNNINEPAGIFENRARELTGHHYLTVTLRGSGANTAGLGSRVLLKTGDTLQVQELSPTRGYQSSVDPRLHFGLGTSTHVDSLVVIWPDHRVQVLTGVLADQLLTLRQEDADGTFQPTPPAAAPRLFEDVTDAVALDYRHAENTFVDFNREPLMPHKLSMEGPALAVGDVDGDGLDDVYAGGAKWQPGRLLVQQRDGRFRSTNEALWYADSLYEDVDAAFFDAENDGDLDLYVVSAGNEFWGEADAMRDRLYLNDGTGRFARAGEALPPFFAHGGCVAPADFDGDGDVDLYVGSRVVARSYGTVPQSYLLENDGTGRFTDVTVQRGAALGEAGMVSDAAWTDYDGDGDLDLVVVGEWMPVRVFAQEQGRFVEQTDAAGLAATRGWWNAVRAADVDGDGDDDLLLGNLGLNSRIRASDTEPARLYLDDFDDNGSLDQILTVYRNGASYPVAPVETFFGHLAFLRQQYPTFASFGARTIDELLPAEALESATVLEATTFASSYAENRGDGTFAVRALPVEAQFAPVYAIVADDLDGDGHMDLLLAGNFSGVTPLRGRYDASYGQLLRGDGTGRFVAVQPGTAGLFLTGDVRALHLLRRPDGSRLLLAARNNDHIQVARLRPPARPLAGAGSRAE